MHERAQSILMCGLAAVLPLPACQTQDVAPPPVTVVLTLPATVSDGSDSVTLATRDIRAFRPSKHGYRFANAFSGAVLSAQSSGLGPLATLVSMDRFGLCGGMSFAAADAYLLGLERDEDTAPPVERTALRELFHRRQIDSLGGLTAGLPEVARFSQWMRASDAGLAGTALATLPELSRIMAQINAGQPAMLGLVLIRSAGRSEVGQIGPEGNLTDNHQVLCYGADSTESGGLTLRIYDPNFPGDDRAVIRVVPAVVAQSTALGPINASVPLLGARMVRIAHMPTKGARSAASGTPSERQIVTPIRGIMLMGYTPARPTVKLRARASEPVQNR